MFCDACGTVVQPGQAYCSKCGKQIVGPISFMQPRAGRVQSHIRFLGMLWLALSAFNTIGGVALCCEHRAGSSARARRRGRPAGIPYSAT